MAEHKRAGAGMALGKHLHFLLSRRGRGSPCTAHLTLLQHLGTPLAGWKWSSSCWQPPRATSATTDPGDNLHLNQAKVENRPRSQPQLPQGQQPPWLPGTTACPAPSHPQGRASRNNLCNDIFSLPLFPLRYFTQAQTQQGKNLPPFRAGTGKS